MLNHYTTKMTGPLETWDYKIQSNIAIWQYIAIHSNAIRNTALTRIVSPLIRVMETNPIRVN